MRPTVRLPFLIAAGVLLLQTAWILAIPPFRGIDEFDHAYRAASVAEGYWNPELTQPEEGRGDLIPVPRSTVVAAREICESYGYTSAATCRPGSSAGDDLVWVASAAARYNPVFYWVIGAPAKAFPGAAGLYVMRIISALLCTAMIGLATWSLSLWARTRWPVLALALGLTPVALYSTTVAAPNGFEMAAALCVWASVLGLATERGQDRHARALIVAATLGAVGLVTVRSLGPLWLAMIIGSTLPLLGTTGVKQLVSKRRAALATATVVVGVGTVAASLWTLTARANALEPNNVAGSPLGAAARLVPLWVFQSIAAFPVRNERAPVLVYACALFAFLGLLIAAFRVANRRGRLVLTAVCMVSLLVPFAFTVATYSTTGSIWQGRYTLPVSIGAVLVSGWALDHASFWHRLLGPFLLAGFACLAIAHTVSIVNVVLNEQAGSPLAGDPRWITAPNWMIATLCVVGVGLWALASRRAVGARTTGAGSTITKQRAEPDKVQGVEPAFDR